MKCPNCDRVSDQSALVKCSHCGESFERGLLEELGHLDYLQKWVDEHRSDIGDYRAGIIQSRVGERQRKLLEGIKYFSLTLTHAALNDPGSVITNIRAV